MLGMELQDFHACRWISLQIAMPDSLPLRTMISCSHGGEGGFDAAT
jgi:hypothetical protein